MREVYVEPIGRKAFHGFGAILEAPSDGLTPWNGRAGAAAVIEMLEVKGPQDATCHLVVAMERHRHSTQAFCPVDVGAYLVVVAPDAPDGGPDLDGLRAFQVPGRTIVQYDAAVWHAPMTSLDAVDRFAMHFHKDGSPADCDLIDIDPVAIRLASRLHPTGDEPERAPSAVRPGVLPALSDLTPRRRHCVCA